MEKLKIFFIIFLFYICFLSSYGLVDPDEPRYAVTAKNMVITENYLVPYFNDKPRLNKPPLTYWIISLSYKILNVNEFSARFPHAILGFFLLLLTYLLIKKFTSNPLLTVLISGSSPLYLFMARYCTTDMILNFFFSLSLIFFYYYYEYKRKEFLILFLLSYLFSNLAKGPVAYFIPIIIFIFLITENNLGFLKNFYLIVGLFIFSIVPLFWLITVCLKLGNVTIIDKLIFNETMGRVFKGYGHKEGIIYYFKYFPLLYFPWSILFLLYLKKIRKFFKDKFFKFNFIWFFVVFLIFTISKSKLMSYILILSIPFGVLTSNLLSLRHINFSLKFPLIFLILFVSCLIGFLSLKGEIQINILIILYFVISILTLYFIKDSDGYIKLGILNIIFLSSILIIPGKFITDLKSEKFLEKMKFEKDAKMFVFRKRYTGTAFYFGNYYKIDNIQDLKKISNLKASYLITSPRNFKKFNLNRFRILKKTLGRILLKLE